jgi:hypothetical protein
LKMAKSPLFDNFVAFKLLESSKFAEKR